ncbi:hypothetical protein E1B28_007204 [Marasmius oreades]|uniref:C-CAP/cofactor C-like domain-containing protein n=1 Tax=Marasmius oreades TaxID=181124 RepID=A0A9P7S1S9_9AGAR|nr:uncharacterized protein E1B28_007204 [Marasmius oreades]KAG7093532.1 hypothetical protein E1B28_007204 [Marasmius oreades]
MSRWGFSQQFLAEFQAEREELIKSGTTLDGVNKLRKKLNDASDSLPAFDQRNCHQQIQELESQVIAPKPTKFSFTRKPKTAPTIRSSPPATAALETTQPLPVSVDEHPLSNITHSIVHIQHELPAVHIHNASNSLIVLTNVSGSAILHDVHDSILIISSHQFRIHNSSNTRINLTTQSTPIIEHSSGLTFNVTDVQDFSHVKPTPSPNWRFDDNSVDVSSILDRLQTPGFNVDDVLKEFLR